MTLAMNMHWKYLPLSSSRSTLQRRFAQRCFVYFVLLCFASASWAQSNATDAAMDGYVTDSTGSAIPQAQIVVRNLSTSITAESTSDASGYYRFPILKIGQYQLTVKAPGFSDLTQTGIMLNVGSQVRIDAKLQLGSTSTVMQVTADSSVVETSTPAVGATIDSTALRVLPVTSRNIYNFTLFSPGVKGNPQSTFSSPLFAFNGITSSQWQLDGLDNTQRNGATPIRLVITTPEVLEQTQVLANGYSAEFGRTAGGILNAVTRSGGNEFHGSGFVMIRPNATRAINALVTTGKPSSKWTDYDGNIGGPIIKNRLFFFANLEYNSLNNPVAVTITPANAAALGLPASEIVGGSSSQRYPTPSVRVDYKINERNNAFLRWTSFSNEQPNNVAGGLTPANTATFFHDRQQGGEAQLTTVLSSSLLNEFRFGVTQRDSLTTPMQTASPNDVIINISGVALIGNSPTQGSHTIERNIQGIDNITKTIRNHTMKFGVDYENTNIAVRNSLTRTYTFSNLASYLATVNGGANSYQQATFQVGNPNVDNVFNFFNAFAQDEWRVRPNLTVNYGVRYQLIVWPQLDPSAPYAGSQTINTSKLDIAPRLQVSYSLSPTTVIRAASGLYFDTPNLGVFDNVSLVNGHRILGYTYTPTTAGAPVFPNIPTASQLLVSSASNIAAYDTNYRDMYSIQSNVQVEHAFTTNFSANAQYSFLSVRRGPYSHDINLGTPVCTLADGRPAYTQKACGLGTSTTLTRPNTQFGQINLISSNANVNYNALDLTLKKRFSHGVQFQATYSWSKALGTVDQANTSLPIYTNPIEDPTNLAREYGPMSSDIRNNFVLQGLYSPTTKLAPLRWTNNLTISSMTYLHSGLPINVYAGSDLNGDGQLNDRPLFTGRNSQRGSNFYQEDTRVAYDIPFRDRYHLNLWTEAENLLNHPNLNCDSSSGCTGAVVNNITSAQYLLPTSVRNPRGLQFGSKITF